MIQNKEKKPRRLAVIHIQQDIHYDFKIFCATKKIDLGTAAEKAIKEFMDKDK